jgi:hypothetical protein
VKKIISLSIALVGLLVIVWLGASFYSARMTGNYVTSLPDLYQQNDFMHIKTIEHQQSLFSSTGKFEIRLPNVAPVIEGAPATLGMIVQYNISNLLLPQSAGRLDWKMSGDESLDPILKKFFGQGPAMQGKGHIGYGGQRHSSVELSEILFKDSQSSLKLTPVTGDATWNNESLQLKLKSDHLNIRADQHVTDWHGMTVDINLTDRQLGTGQYAFSIDKGASFSSTYEQMKVIKTVSLKNDRINMSIAQTAKHYAFDKLKLTDFDQEIALKEVDLNSLLTLTSILRDAKDVKSLSAAERTKVAAALRTIFNKGFSFGIPRLSTKIDSGSLTGKLNVEVLKAEGGPEVAFSSAQRLRAEGNVELTGKGGLTNAQRTTALMLGLAVQTPDGLKSSLEFSNGVVNANGKTFNVKDNLIFIDNIINGMLNQ